MEILMKPHHFMDIIKLYGTGIKRFVPNEAYNHDFYRIGNLIIGERRTVVRSTVDNDAICGPCYYLGDDGKCADSVTHIEGEASKDAWNKILDRRILAITGIELDKPYTAEEYCRVLYLNRHSVYDIWREETDEKKRFRFENFTLGAEEYLILK